MYQVAIVEHKSARGENAGLQYDGMSAVISLAFSIEAILNFVGERTPGLDWNERAKYKQKIAALEKQLGFQYIKTN